MLSRRTFLYQGAAGALALSRVDAAQATPPRITYGFSLYGMPSLTLDAGLDACAKIGYDAVELAVMPDWPAEPRRLGKDERQRLRRKLRDLNLSLAALMENTPLDADDKTRQTHLDRLQAAAELGHALSPEAPPIVETILGGKPGQWYYLRGSYADRLARWARIGEKTRTVFCIKPHRMQAMNHPDHVLWLLEQVKSPWIRVDYDYSHFQYRDLTLEGTLRALLPQTRFVHVKDVRVENDRVTFLLPGDGKVDYAALFEQLQKGKYQGSVCVEVSRLLSSQKGYDPLAAARRSYENLLPALRKAGLRRG